jgi:hypothetical protein
MLQTDRRMPKVGKDSSFIIGWQVMWLSFQILLLNMMEENRKRFSFSSLIRHFLKNIAQK